MVSKIKNLARRLNDSMGSYVGSQIVKGMFQKGINVCGSKVLMLGITFKENCPDIRNTRAVDVYQSLKEYGLDIDIYDPGQTPQKYSRNTASLASNNYPHNNTMLWHSPWRITIFLDIYLNNVKAEQCFVYDVKGVLENRDLRL